MKKKIIITGANGLIGKEALRYLVNEDFEIYAISARICKNTDINWIECNLFDTEKLKNVFETVKPQYLLHFAWITGGDYLTNDDNILLEQSSEKMLSFFKNNGGKRAIYAGTCFEYKLTGEILKEDSPLESNNLYEQSKTKLHDFCFDFAKKNDLSFGWGRIFYVYGHNEKSSRLTSLILDSLKNNKEFTLGAPNNCLDYMYSKEIARAFVEFLKSDYSGNVNICTGKGILLKDYALKLQKLYKKDALIKFDPDKKATLNIVGDNSILKNIIGFKPQYEIDEALKEIIDNL